MTTRTLRTRVAPLMLTTVLLGGMAITTAQPAQAAKAKPTPYYLKFDKNQSDPTKSRLYLMKKGSKGKADTSVASWRAGSGNGSKNACASNAGWLPNGTYDIEFRSTSYNGSAIKGYVIKLENKWCAGKKTQRTDLFIHSEMQKNGKQGPKKGADSPWRWDGDRDYKSLGCIKLKPADIKNLFSTAGSKGWPKTLKVVS
ncbi:L,D-transpeptidase [Streptomyces sp. TRM64462]|uniref:L,D-transpeptidase n=1 Tax=Streptomyces sp. TRM64462 TaxID=2741726 RepID=UPI0020C7F4A1|nr:L,D-transpeptidase [Streptomyces sp. TRM64462]